MSLVVLGAGLALAGPAAAADQPIAFADYAYSPPTATIKAGDTVTFSGDFSAPPAGVDRRQRDQHGHVESFPSRSPGTYALLLPGPRRHANNMVGRSTWSPTSTRRASPSASAPPRRPASP